jgi:hypothetical protein
MWVRFLGWCCRQFPWSAGRFMTRSGHASRIGLQWREIASLARHARAYRVMPGGADVGISPIVAIITVPLFDEIDSSIFFGR